MPSAKESSEPVHYMHPHQTIHCLHTQCMEVDGC